MAVTDEDAFEALQQFAAVWHDKYVHANGGENRKPPSLTMRADGGAAVLTEPQLRAVVAEYAHIRAELQRYRGVDAAAKELLARNVELGTRADNAETKCEDLEDEVARLRERLRRDPIRGTYYPAAEAFTAAETRMQAAYEANEGGDDV